jgi:hypothetical protein
MHSVQAFSRPSVVTFVSNGTERPDYKHCPLCIESMVYPEQDAREPVFIFLDVDGVLKDHSSEVIQKISSTARELFPKTEPLTDYHWTIAKARHLNPGALRNLNTLIERIEIWGKRALVVLSSSWRNDATLQQHREEVFAQHLFCKYLAGKVAPANYQTEWTPESKQGFNFKYGAEDSFGIELNNKDDVIEFWLRDHGFRLEEAGVVVFDDDPNVGEKRLKKCFIKVDDLLSLKNIQQAFWVLRPFFYKKEPIGLSQLSKLRLFKSNILSTFPEIDFSDIISSYPEMNDLAMAREQAYLLRTRVFLYWVKHNNPETMDILEGLEFLYAD